MSFSHSFMRYIDVRPGSCRFHQGDFKNNYATFQQYTIVPAEIVAKVAFRYHSSLSSLLSHIFL